ARCSTRVSCRAPWTAAWTNDRSDMMATAQADLRRKTGKSELRDPRGGERTPKDALRSLPATIAWLQREGLLMETDVPVSGDLEVNKYILPIRHTHLESEITIGSGNSVVVGERFWGGSHIGYNRMNFRWGNVGTFQISPGSHMWQVMTKYYKDDPVPLTICFGLPVAATLLAGGGFDYVVLPRGGDELGAAGAVQGFPMRLVKARTVDAYAVADCEIVLEGFLRPRDKRYETKEAEEHDTQGRYHFHPEWAGYMGKAYKAPTFEVT